MLTTLLSSIQSQLFSKSLLVSNLLPLTLFIFANALMCKLYSPETLSQIRIINAASDKSLLYPAGLCTVFVAAYVLSTLNTALLEMLEGKRPPVRWFRPFLYPGQLHRVARLDKTYDEANAWRGELVVNGDRWIAELDQALAEQDDRTTLGVPYPVIADDINAHYLSGEAVAPAELERAVDEFVRAINATDVRSPLTQSLRNDVEKVKRAIRFSRDKFLFDQQQVFTERQFTFPGVYPARDILTSNTILAPTKIGNIGLTMRSYALLRYRLDLNIFWGRLQGTIETSAKTLFEKLADAKVRVDALVTLFWLTVVFAAWWTAWLAIYGTSVRGLWVVGAGGPLVAALWYELACESYTVMADLVRGAVDLCRFNLLRELNLTPPVSSVDEPALWLALGNAIGYSDGRPVFQYDVKKP